MSAFQTNQIGKTELTIDALGFGCASLGNLYHAVSDEDASDILSTARANGFRYFDTAPHYGQGLSERRVGDALRGSSDYVLSTKVGRLLRPAGYASERHGFISTMPFDIEYDYSYDGVMRSFEDSLQQLALDRSTSSTCTISVPSLMVTMTSGCFRSQWTVATVHSIYVRTTLGPSIC